MRAKKSRISFTAWRILAENWEATMHSPYPPPCKARSRHSKGYCCATAFDLRKASRALASSPVFS